MSSSSSHTVFDGKYSEVSNKLADVINVHAGKFGKN